MGQPRKQRKKYSTPKHPWQKERIDEEKELIKIYGLKNKKEIWKMNSLMKKFTSQAKRLTSLTTKQADIEKSQFLAKLQNYGIIDKKAGIEEVLTITLKDILERRLQTLVYKKNLARSTGQARQFITHRHILVGNKTITRPSYLATRDEEGKITFTQSSSLSDSEHPERKIEEKEKAPKKVKKKEDKKKAPAKKAKDKEKKE